jgi:hypothetical protein
MRKAVSGLGGKGSPAGGVPVFVQRARQGNVQTNEGRQPG